MFGIRYIALSWLRITWVRNDAPYLTICRPFRASHVALSVLYIRDSAQLDRAAPPRFPRSPEGAAYKSEAV